MRISSIPAGLLCVLTACSSGPLARVFQPATPWEEYENRLRESGLAESGMGRAWLRAGQSALAAPLTAELPLRESGYFPPEVPTAIGYRIELTRGRTFEIDIRFQSAEPARLFVDLFELRDDGPRRIASLRDSTVLREEIRRTGVYLLRLQPELLRSGRYTVTQRTLASIRFPVPRLGTGAIQSRFGVPREAGRRQHHGVDIFAPRGTPVVAVRNGTARPSTNELGGLVVWLRDDSTRRTYYYAHLDRWAFENTRPVSRGDTVGFIGNTGNARTTPPHLHFGIYESGPVDPFPFLAPDDPVPPPVEFPAERWNEWVRITPLRSELRVGPHEGAPALIGLDRGVVARALAADGRSVRVRLPDGVAGYVLRTAVTPAANPLRRAGLPAGSVLRESPRLDAPAVQVLERDASAEVWGRFGEFELVQVAGSRPAWVPIR